MDAEWVVLELGRLAFADLRKLLGPRGTLKELHELDADAAASLAAFDVVETTTVRAGPDGVTEAVTTRVRKVRLWDKRAALETLARVLGLATGGKGKPAAAEAGPVVVRVLGDALDG